MNIDKTGTGRMNTQSFTRRQSFARQVLPAIGLAAAFVACAPQTAWPDDKGLANSYTVAPGERRSRCNSASAVR